MRLQQLHTEDSVAQTNVAELKELSAKPRLPLPIDQCPCSQLPGASGRPGQSLGFIRTAQRAKR